MQFTTHSATLTGTRGGSIITPFLPGFSRITSFAPALRKSLTIELPLPAPIDDQPRDMPPTLVTVYHVSPRPG